MFISKVSKADEEFFTVKEHLETNYKTTFNKANDGVWCCKFGRFRFEMWLNSEGRWATCFMHADDRGTLLGTAYSLYPINSFALALERFHSVASDVPRATSDDLIIKKEYISKNHEPL